MERTLEPELLDQMAPADPAAHRSRRDLVRINALMGNSAWMRRQLRSCVSPGERVLEVGAGDGCARLERHPGRHHGLDLWPRPSNWPPDAGWHETDVMDFADWASYPVVCGNLVFHHFSACQLAELGMRIRAHARLFMACEPFRGSVFQRIFPKICTMLGADPVTRHDGLVSIAAGFRGAELGALMGFNLPGWRCRASATCRGAYHFIATRT